MVSSTTATTANSNDALPPPPPATSAQDKNHTFRKRRLSLPLHHLLSNEPTAAAAATSAELTEAQRVQQEAAADHTATTTMNEHPADHQHHQDKAHTFRKRRLSLTANTVETADATIAITDIPSSPITRRRRSSVDSSSSSNSQQKFVSRTVHAGELLHADAPPPSPATDESNILYQWHHRNASTSSSSTTLPPPPPFVPNNQQQQQQQQHQPKWKRRRTVHHDNELHKLPFSRDVVGTYSCHGIEPVYGSEYDDDDDDDEELPQPGIVAQDNTTTTTTTTTSQYNNNNNKDPWLSPQLKDDNGDAAIAAPSSITTTTATTTEPSTKKDDNNNASAPLPATNPTHVIAASNTPQKHTKEEEEDDELPVKTPEPPQDKSSSNSSDNDVKPAVVSENQQPSPNNDNDNEDQEEPPVTVAKINQDRGGVAFPYGNCPKTALFCVYDGHGQGGELVSQFALHEVQCRLEKHAKFRTNLTTAFKETFLAVDDALRHEPLIEPLFAGTTACVALLQDTTLTVANAGDSRAVIARKLVSNNNHAGSSSSNRYIALDLTKDQNPDVPDEMERILSAGGYVSMPPGPGLSARVWLDPMCTQIGLAMARSIGDHAVGSVGVIAEPEVSTHEIAGNDEFMILASDGVWEFIDSTTAVQIVARNLDKGATKACQALIEAAAAKWHEEEGAYRDDITAIVVKLQDLWKGAADLKTRSDSVSTTDASVGS